MATTMSLIAKQTVGSGGAASVTFSNIPQTFTDLKIVLSARDNYGSDSQSNCSVTINGSTSNFSSRNVYGYGTGQASASRSDNLNVFLIDSALATSNTFSNCELYFPNYTSGNNKSFSAETATETNASIALLQMTAALWSNTSAITSITLASQNGSLVEFSEFSLYGISNSSTQNTTTPLASGGDIIKTDGTYWYHTFLYSGTFTPIKNLTCDYLVVAGGGGSGSVRADASGGGGGGGLRSSVSPTGGGGTTESQLSLTANTAYTATVGAGGAGGSSDTSGTNGNNSILGSITSTGGGGGAWANASATINGNSGGSGGGGNGSGSGGSGTSGQGYAGGSGYAGGGGAGGVGSASAFNGTNKGGIGVTNSISGSAVNYAGGGNPGGGTGNTYGGGNGEYALDSNNATAGTANTGGGGGGGWYSVNSNRTGKAGGSGIIVVRYPVL
jgi:hypothetical protein